MTENSQSFDKPFKKNEEDNSLFLNLLDFHIVQQIFIQLTNIIPILTEEEEDQIEDLRTKRDLFFEKHKKHFENCLLFSSVCSKFNLISKNTLFNINIYQNEIIIQNIKYPIFLKLNCVQQDITLEHLTDQKIVSKQEFLNRMLFCSSENGFYDLIKPLVLNGAKVNYETDMWSLKTNSLAQSCRRGYSKTTKKLIKYGANINWKDKFGSTLLHSACENTHSNNLNLVKYLIELGLNVNSVNKMQEIPLFKACYFGNLDIVKYLISVGANIHQQNKYQQTILFTACRSRNLELIQYLLDLNLDINHISSLGLTCLHVACDFQYLATVKFLISKGADVSIKDRDRTHLDIVKAKNRPNAELIKELEKYF